LLILAFGVLFLIGAAILAFAETANATVEANHLANPDLKPSRLIVIGIPFLQHLASALIVAAVMGVTYEYFVHKHVIEDFDDILAKHEQATENTLNAMLSTTARDVFAMIGDIAKHNERVPTLFKPPRQELDEYVFAANIAFFENLIGGSKAREDAVDVLRSWLKSDVIQLQFLASDFVGRLRLHELAPLLKELAVERQANWSDLKDKQHARSVILNFWWAASACEDEPYQLLRRLLIEWDEAFVQQWILFVPQQMPDAKLAQIVKLFLRLRGERASSDVIKTAIAAIEKLHHRGFNMRRAVNRYRTVFERAGMWREACDAVSAAPAPTRPGWRTRLRRFVGWP